MKKTRIIGRIVAGAAVSALLLSGAFAGSVQAKDTGWPTGVVSAAGDNSKQLRDTGWRTG